MTLHALPNIEEYVDRKEAASHLGVSVRTLDRMRSEGLPHWRYGRKLIRFRRSEITRWAEDNWERAA